MITGSPAAALGLLPDDMIVRIDDYSIRTCREFREILGKYGPGDEVALTWKRGTKVQQGKLVLAAEPKK